MHERVSEESSGSRIVLTPSARVAMIRALIVWDFYPGIRTVPETRAGRIVLTIQVYYRQVTE